MTVIMGVNLSDRIYIAGDSRVSTVALDPEGHETVSFKHDNMLKVESLKKSGGVLVASAGDAEFAAYVLARLKKAGFYGAGVAVMREEIETFLREAANDFYAKRYTSAAFIFAGPDKSKNKTIVGKDLLPLIKAYGGKEDGNSGNLKEVIVKGLQSKGDGVPNPYPELPTNNTMLFAARVSPSGVEIEDTKWGEFLIYGPKGVVKDDVPGKVIGQLEFDQDAGNVQHDTLLITALIHDLAASKRLGTVGGCVVVLSAASDGNTYVMDGDVYAQDMTTGVTSVVNRFEVLNNKFYRKDIKGTRYRLRPVSELDFSDGRLLI